jgi:CBS domain containing-hemolysin-like protein
MDIVLPLLATFGLVLANAFFVASEFAIVKIRPTRLEELARKGPSSAKTALAMTKRLDAYLSANQLGITLASLALGWVGESALARIIHPLVGSSAAAHTIGVVVSFVIITFLHTVLGELAPKSLAIQYTEPVTLWTARPLRVFYIVAYPLIWTLNGAANLVLRIMGLRAASEVEMLHSPGELRLVMQHVDLAPGARRLIDRVFDYTHRVARHVMTLRQDVTVLEASMTFDEAIRVAVANQYTRYPLLDRETDKVVGYMHIKDLFALLAGNAKPKSMRDFSLQPLFVKEDSPLEGIRRDLQQKRVHLAVVLDAEGTWSGIVTLEDLLEEFVGEIQDEQDVGEVPPIVRHEDGSFEVDGRVTIDVARRELNLNLDDAAPEEETMGGYVMGRLGEIPRAGVTVETAECQLTVVEVRMRRVRRIRGTLRSKDEHEREDLTPPPEEPTSE